MSQNATNSATPENDEEPDFAEAFALGATVPELVKKFKVHRRTIYRWLDDPLVQARIHEVRAKTLSSVSGKAHEELRGVMERLCALTHHEDARIRLMACTAYIDRLAKLKDIEEIRETVRRLEEDVAALKAGKAAKA